MLKLLCSNCDELSGIEAEQALLVEELRTLTLFVIIWYSYCYCLNVMVRFRFGTTYDESDDDSIGLSPKHLIFTPLGSLCPL